MKLDLETCYYLINAKTKHADTGDIGVVSTVVKGEEAAERAAKYMNRTYNVVGTVNTVCLGDIMEVLELDEKIGNLVRAIIQEHKHKNSKTE